MLASSLRKLFTVPRAGNSALAPARQASPTFASWLVHPWRQLLAVVSAVSTRKTFEFLRGFRYLLPSGARQQIRSGLLRWMRRGQAKQTGAQQAGRVRTLPADTPAGLNLIGYFGSSSGTGESARLCAQAAHSVGLPHTTHDLTTFDLSLFVATPPQLEHAFNVLHFNADQLAAQRAQLGPGLFAGRYTIGVWHWELPVFPDCWRAAFDEVDELWAPSRFIQDALAIKANCPVVRIPHGVRCSASPTAARSEFNLPAHDVLFLMMFDVQSFPERKNPAGAIEAFRRAFGNTPGVTLVIKVNDSNRAAGSPQVLAELLHGMSNVQILKERLSRQQVYDLISVCDCTLSLHRSEGYGLVLAESMALGKPVVATGWSGNVDFMTPDNSGLVRYRLTELQRDIGPYEKGQLWAEPDLDHAAELLKRIAAEPTWAQQIAAAGQATMLAEYTPERIGAMYRQRLNVLRGCVEPPATQLPAT